MKPIKDFLTAKAKSLNLTDLYFELTNIWEEDRGADGEALFDLQTEDDAIDWIKLYGTECYVKCYSEYRYWWGGWQFAENEEDKKNNLTPCIIHGFDFATGKDIDNVLGEIEYLVKFNMEYSGLEIDDATKIYHGLIDFDGYFSQEKNKDIEKYIRKVYEPCGDFDLVDMEIEHSDRICHKDDIIDFYWIKCTKNGKSCDMDYSCIKYNGEIYLPVGERDVYPLDVKELHNYKWVKMDENGDFERLYFDKHLNPITEDEQKLMWAVDNMLGEDYLPNFLMKNDSLDDMRDEIIQEFTLCLYDRYKEHIGARDLFCQYCKDCAINFISLYNHTDFSEENSSYYDYVDHYIDELCSEKVIDRLDWWSA